MDVTTVVLVTASEVLNYAAAFFFVLVAVALAYALVRVGNVLGRADKILDDIDREAVPLLRKSGETLDGVNGSLANVDEITRDVADMTDKVNGLVGAVDSALQTPAKKAAAFSSGVQQAVSSFLRRDQGGSAGSGSGAASASTPPAWEAPPASTAGETAAEAAERAADAAESVGDTVANAASTAAYAAESVGESVTEAAAAAGETAGDAAATVADALTDAGEAAAQAADAAAEEEARS